MKKEGLGDDGLANTGKTDLFKGWDGKDTRVYAW